MTSLDLIKTSIASGTKLDLTDSTTNQQVTQFLTQLAKLSDPEREEGEDFSLLANSGDGNFLISTEGTSFEIDGEAVDEIDLLDLFSLDDIDLSEIDFGDLELDEELLELIEFLMEDEDLPDLLSEEELDPEIAGGDEAVKSAVEAYQEKLAKQLEEMDEMLAIGDLSAQAQKEIQERYSKVQTLRAMESESLMTLMKAMLSINSMLNALIKSHNDEMKQTFSR
jgi:hypothetical protein